MAVLIINDVRTLAILEMLVLKGKATDINHAVELIADECYRIHGSGGIITDEELQQQIEAIEARNRERE